jgi:hypothetical protein
MAEIVKNCVVAIATTKFHQKLPRPDLNFVVSMGCLRRFFLGHSVFGSESICLGSWVKFLKPFFLRDMLEAGSISSQKELYGYATDHFGVGS